MKITVEKLQDGYCVVAKGNDIDEVYEVPQSTLDKYYSGSIQFWIATMQEEWWCD